MFTKVSQGHILTGASLKIQQKFGLLVGKVTYLRVRSEEIRVGASFCFLSSDMYIAENLFTTYILNTY